MVAHPRRPRRRRARGEPVVPRRPRPASSGSTDASVCSTVSLREYPNAPSSRRSAVGRIDQHAQGLVGVGRDHRRVERRLTSPSAVRRCTPSRSPRRTRSTGVLELDVVQPLGDPLDVGPRATDHRPPLWRAADRQHAVVVEEREQVDGPGSRMRRAGSARPHGRDHRHEEVLLEVRRRSRVAVAISSPIVDVVVVGRRATVGRRDGSAAISASIRTDSRGRRSTRCSETGRRARAAPAYSSPHPSHDTDMLISARPRLHAELVEQAGQQRVGPLVVDDEAAVDRQRRPAAVVDVVGVGVTAEPARRLRTASRRARRG